MLVRLVGPDLPGTQEHTQAYQCDHRTAGEHYRGLVADDEILHQRKGEQAYRREHCVGEGRTGSREDSGETAPAEGLLYHQYQHRTRRHSRADSYEKGSEYFYGHILTNIWILGELAKNIAPRPAYGKERRCGVRRSLMDLAGPATWGRVRLWEDLRPEDRLQACRRDVRRTCLCRLPWCRSAR